MFPVLDQYSTWGDELASCLEDMVAGLSRELDRRSKRAMAVYGRLKTRESLEGKISGRPGRYNSLREITDVIGIRVVAFFSDDVDAIGEVVRDVFEVDDFDSVDKRIELAPREFGYVSLHLVVHVPRDYQEGKLEGFKAEIQIRSILQHAWAEIEHDLGYKSDVETPVECRRQFSRLAGLLEIADAAFIDLRESLSRYESRVAAAISNDEGNIDLDLASLSAFIESKEVTTLDNELSSIAGARLVKGEVFAAELLVEMIDSGLVNVADLEELLHGERECAVDLARAQYSQESFLKLFTGTGLLFCLFSRILRNSGVSGLRRHLEEFGTPSRMEAQFYSQLLGGALRKKQGGDYGGPTR